MVNGSKNMDLMLGGQKPYLDKIRLGFKKEDDMKSSKSPQIKFLHVYIVSKGDTLLKNASPEGKLKSRK